MLKSIFIFINLISLLLFSIFSPENTTITHSACNTKICDVVQGEFKEVKIIINNKELSGPGRLKLDLENAKGVKILEKESDGSSFTFKNNEGLFIWYDLPSNKNIEITYIINPSDSTEGLKKITGTFSYISNNDRVKYEIDTLSINVIKKDKEHQDILVKTNRTIEGKDGEYIVKIHTLKGKHNGFARIKDLLPKGYIATPIESAGAVFKNIDGSAKFIWSDLHSSIESFTVSYKLVNPSKKDTSFKIDGVYASEKLIQDGQNTGIPIPTTFYNPENNQFTYNELTNDTSTKNKIEDSIIEDKTQKIEEIISFEEIEKNQNDLSNNEIEDSIELSNNEIEDSIIKEKAQEIQEIISFEEIEKNQTELSDNEIEENEMLASNNSENIITSEKTNNTINYKVQILAAHRIASKKHIYNEFKFTEKFDLENHEGWIKYTTGFYKEYKSARNKRNSLEPHEFPGPFVTAYNHGERITVQEALIISNQKWIQ